MSRTLPESEGTPSPVDHFVEWKSKKGAFCYYDKQAEKEINLCPPGIVTLAVLAKGFKVGGGKKVKGAYYSCWSNEGFDYGNDVLVARSKMNVAGPIAEGTWADIKPQVVSQYGGKHVMTLWCVAWDKETDPDSYKIWHLQLTGTIQGEMIDLKNEMGNDFWIGHGLYWDGKTANTHTGENGDYYTPKWSQKTLSPAFDDVAGEAQKKVRAYIRDYQERDKEPEERKPVDATIVPDKPVAATVTTTLAPDDHDQIPF